MDVKIALGVYLAVYALYISYSTGIWPNIVTHAPVMRWFIFLFKWRGIFFLLYIILRSRQYFRQLSASPEERAKTWMR